MKFYTFIIVPRRRLWNSWPTELANRKNCLLCSYLLHREESFLTTQPILGYSKNSSHFMEPEGSLQRLQLPASLSLSWARSIHSMPPIPLPEDLS